MKDFSIGDRMKLLEGEEALNDLYSECKWDKEKKTFVKI